MLRTATKMHSRNINIINSVLEENQSFILLKSFWIIFPHSEGKRKLNVPECL